MPGPVPVVQFRGTIFSVVSCHTSHRDVESASVPNLDRRALKPAFHNVAVANTPSKTRIETKVQRIFFRSVQPKKTRRPAAIPRTPPLEAVAKSAAEANSIVTDAVAFHSRCRSQTRRANA